MITSSSQLQGPRATAAPAPGVENFGRAKGGGGRSSARHK
jgi:hypothetical protein